MYRSLNDHLNQQQSMKMIATTRLGKAQEAMRAAKGYGEANQTVFNESQGSGDKNQVETASGDKEKVLWVVASSDRGLCGGIHSSVSKKYKRELAASPEGAQVVVLGDKSRAQLQRANPENIVLTFNQIGKQVPTFLDACAIANMIEESKVEFDKVNVIYNKVLSAVSLVLLSFADLTSIRVGCLLTPMMS